jgi:hypothetical protein
MGGVEAEAEERASGTSLPAHAIKVEVGEGTSSQGRPQTDTPERVVRYDYGVCGRPKRGEGHAERRERGRYGEGDGERGERGIAEQGRVRVVVCCVRTVS